MINKFTNHLYKEAGLSDFNFFASKLKMRASHQSSFTEKLIPGFFSPYQSFADFGNQFISPLAMLVICLTETVIQVCLMLREITYLALRMITLDFDRAFAHLGKIAIHGGSAIVYTLSAVVDCVSSLVALVTRTLSSLGAGVVAVAEAIHNGINPPNDITYDSIHLAAESSDAAAYPFYDSDAEVYAP